MGVAFPLDVCSDQKALVVWASDLCSYKFL
jgi:hypothetical protein